MLYMDVPVVVGVVLNLYGLTLRKIHHPIKRRTFVFIPFLGGYTSIQINASNVILQQVQSTASFLTLNLPTTTIVAQPFLMFC
jgi:hypothetical protein